MTETKLKWGHPLLNPEGVEIRVPSWIFPALRSVGLLVKNEAGQPQVSPEYYRVRHLAILEAEKPRESAPAINYAIRLSGAGRKSACGKISRILNALGPDCSGPAWPVCHCKCCLEEHGLLPAVRPAPEPERFQRPEVPAPILPNMRPLPLKIESRRRLSKADRRRIQATTAALERQREAMLSLLARAYARC